MSTENETSSVVKPKCRICAQELPHYCDKCHQPYIDIEKDRTRCKSCSQVIPFMVAGEKLEEQLQMKNNPDYEEFEKQKDGTHRIICTCCKRKLQQCPACEIFYDSEEDRKIRKRKSSKDQSNSEDSSQEDDEDSNAEHPRQKLRSLQKRIRKNEDEATDESEKESDDEEEEEEEDDG